MKKNRKNRGSRAIIKARPTRVELTDDQKADRFEARRIQRKLYVELMLTVTTEDVRQMARAIIDKAKVEGDVFAFREILDRTIGKTTQTMDITSNGKPIKGYIGIDVEKDV